ncbi:TPA: hypothetical protein KE579_001302 [Citrobacter braakii]|nr:hypothetical protein [Citrobacter braakii]
MKIDFPKELADQLYDTGRNGGGNVHQIVKEALAAYLATHPRNPHVTRLNDSAEGKNNVSVSK